MALPVVLDLYVTRRDELDGQGKNWLDAARQCGWQVDHLWNAHMYRLRYTVTS